MNKVVFSVSILLLSALFSCSSSKNIGTTSMPDPKPKTSKSDSPKVVVKVSEPNQVQSQTPTQSVSQTQANSPSQVQTSPTTSVASVVQPVNSKSANIKPSNSANVVVKEERVTIIEEVGTPVEPGKYYLIMGSFKVLENARNLKKQLIIDRFNPLLLQNEDGLYRVAAGTFSQEAPARDRIETIRAQSDKYDDVWLLVQKQ